MNKIILFVKKYLVDIIIQAGVLILFNETFRPIYKEGIFGGYGTWDYSPKLKLFGIMLISIGINIAIRKYLQSKNF